MRPRDHRRGADSRRRDGIGRQAFPTLTIEDGGYALFSAPQRGEYANTTNFITSDNWQASLDINAQCGGVRHVAMFTDGIQSIALNAISDNTQYSPFFDPLFRWLERQVDYEDAGDSLAAFHSSPKVTARADDDLTLLLAVRGSEVSP